MKKLFQVICAMALVTLAATPGAAQTSTVSCGLVRVHTPATASSAGRFALVNPSGPITVITPAGSVGVTFPPTTPRDRTNWVCVQLVPGSGDGSWTFVAMVQPGSPGYEEPRASIACGTAGPGPRAGDGLTSLNASAGILVLDTPADQSSPGYQCVRYLPAATGGPINYFVSYVRAGDPGFVPQSSQSPATPSVPGSLPATSTAPREDSWTLAFVAGVIGVLGAIRLRKRGVRLTRR